jgi:hypothetical protein
VTLSFCNNTERVHAVDTRCDLWYKRAELVSKKLLLVNNQEVLSWLRALLVMERGSVGSVVEQGITEERHAELVEAQESAPSAAAPVRPESF